MLATLHSATVIGIDAALVDVQIDVSPGGIPAFSRRRPAGLDRAREP